MDNAILTKLQKLLAHADSAKEIGNLEEAEAFGAKAAELLAKYKLSMSDVEMHQQDEISGKFGTDVAEPTDRQGKQLKSRSPWQEDLAVIIARAHFCRILVHGGTNRITFVGRETDRETAVYVFMFLVQTMYRLCHKAYTKQRRVSGVTKGFKIAYYLGFVNALRARLAEQEKVLTSGGTALVRLKDVRKEVDDWMNKTMRVGKARAVHHRTSYNVSGYQAGEKAGREVSINPGVGGGSKPKGHLN